MKRTLGMLLVLTMIIGLLPAYAAGGIETTEETWYAVSKSDDYKVYYYSTVTNTGDEPAAIKNLLFEIKDADDQVLESTSKFSLYPSVLTPGQTGWLVITQDVKDIAKKAVIDHCDLEIAGKVDDDHAANLLPATAEYLKEDEDENEDMLRIAVTNPGEGNAFEITAAMAARDASGKLLYIVGAGTRDIGLPAGGALTLRSQVRSDIMDALEDENAEIASVEALAYTVEDLDD